MNTQNTKVSNKKIEGTTENGEFWNCTNTDSIVLSYWQKHEMESLKKIDPSFFIYLSQMTYNGFQFQRDRAPCMGINAYLGKDLYQYYQVQLYMTLTMLL